PPPRRGPDGSTRGRWRRRRGGPSDRAPAPASARGFLMGSDGPCTRDRSLLSRPAGGNIMRRLSTALFLLLSSVVVVGGAACGGSQAPQQAKTDPSKPDKPADKRNDPVKAEIQSGPGNATPPPTDPIYFDFDTSLIKDESKTTLQTIADYLEKNAGASVT